MKSIQELSDTTAAGRKTTLVNSAKAGRSAPIVIAKVLFVAGMKADYEEGGMNAYSQKATGLDIRRELQGTYERVNLLTAMHKKELDMTEIEFDECLNFAAIKLASLVKKGDTDKIAQAMAIIRSGENVTKDIKALCSPPKKDKAEGEDKPQGQESPELQTPPADVDVFTIPHGEYVTNHRPLVDRILQEIKDAAPEDLAVLETIYSKLLCRVSEAQTKAMKPAKVRKVKIAA